MSDKVIQAFRSLLEQKKNSPSASDKKYKINSEHMTIQVNTHHSEKNRVETFLNALNEKLEQLPFDWESLKESNRIDDAVKFANHNNSLVITVILVKDYWDADRIAKANFMKEATRWGQNGAIMYVVESADEDIVSKVVGTFAGKE
jgi:hypothetical protein